MTFGHHLMAYVEMLGRDRGRFADARKRLNESPLGAAALAGTSFPIDRAMTAAALGFDRPAANSLDAVSDRDFAVEALSAASLTAIHLSRFAEEIVIWSSAGFRFVQLSDKFTTGSSIMPQKRNPDAAELVRAKAGRIVGALTGLIVVLKGLPLAYAKDMQEDKEPVFDAFGALELSIAAMTGMVADMEPDVARPAQGGRRRLFHRHRPRRLAGADPRPALPRSPSPDRADRGGSRATRRDARPPAARRAPGNRARASPTTSIRCSRCASRSGAARASAARRRRTCAARPAAG